MKVTCVQNGRIELRLEPQDAIESAFVDALLDRAEKGQVSRIAPGEESGLILAMEK